MAEVMQHTEFKNDGKRRAGKKKGKMANKRPKFTEKRDKVDRNMKKLFAKRAREYNSDDEDEAEIEELKENGEELEVEFPSEDGVEDDQLAINNVDEVSDYEDGEIETGISKFAEGIRAFRLAFKKILKKNDDDDDILGPVLSGQKKLLAEKLAEKESERKVKGEAKKEKNLIKEKGHVKPANYLDTHEKFLLGVATKGVVKLFNAVNKAQNAQRGLNPSRSKDEKVIKKRRKEAFFSELGKKSSDSSGKFVKGGTSGGPVDDEAPAWAPLRDNYMITKPKLKDWDKMQDTNDADDFGRQSDTDSSSGDD